MRNLFLNTKEHRPRAWLRLILVIGLFLLSTLILAAITTVIAIKFTDADAKEIKTLLKNPLVVSFIELLTIWISYLVASRWLDRRPLVDFGFRFNRLWWRDFGFGLLLGAALMVLVFGVELLAGWVTVTGTLQPMVIGQPFWSGILLFAAVFLCVGISEEMLSRGYLLRNLAEGLQGKYLNPKMAVLTAYILSSMVFGVLHLANPNTTLISTILLMAGGLFLGLGYILTGDLAIPIGLHMTWNFFQGNVFGFPVSGRLTNVTVVAIKQSGPALFTGGAFGPEAGLLALAAIALGCVIILLWVRKTRGTAKLEEHLAIYTV